MNTSQHLGTFPDSLADHKHLKDLDMINNYITGALPTSLCNIDTLRVVTVGNMSVCYPLCIQRHVRGANDLEDINRCQDKNDIALCMLITTTNIDEIIPVTYDEETDIYESSHPSTGSL
jgi:hypothetical protein